jgi:alkyl hydroperoxide reductase subunit AhpC
LSCTLADSTGIISNDFNSLLREEDGIVYSDRTVFIIDKEGIVQYINDDYDVVADLTNLEEAILALSK